MSISAMKQALRVLNHIQMSIGTGTATIHCDSATWHDSDAAITALRQAIEQAEKQEPTLWLGIGGDGRVKYTTDSDRALKWKQAGSYRLVRDYYTSPINVGEKNS